MTTDVTGLHFDEDGLSLFLDNGRIVPLPEYFALCAQRAVTDITTDRLAQRVADAFADSSPFVNTPNLDLGVTATPGSGPAPQINRATLATRAMLPALVDELRMLFDERDKARVENEIWRERWEEMPWGALTVLTGWADDMIAMGHHSAVKARVNALQKVKEEFHP